MKDYAIFVGIKFLKSFTLKCYFPMPYAKAFYSTQDNEISHKPFSKSVRRKIAQGIIITSLRCKMKGKYEIV